MSKMAATQIRPTVALRRVEPDFDFLGRGFSPPFAKNLPFLLMRIAPYRVIGKWMKIR